MTETPEPVVGETREVTTPDGRTLAYIEFGNPDGPLILHNHGGPSSRLEGVLLADGATKHRLRLVSVDRPGIGRSTPQDERSYEGWAADLCTIADALGRQQFGVSGWSEGGPWPLAAAYYIDPARLRHVTSIAGGDYGTFGDDWAAPYLSEADALGGKLALHHHLAFHLMYELLGVGAAHFTRAYVNSLVKVVNNYGAALLGRPEIAHAFGAMSAECFAQGPDGLIADSVLLYRRWPFDVREIERRVHIWQGTEDHLVPLPINQRVAEETPGAVWHQVEGAGHLVAIGEADEIFAIAATELRA